MCDCEPIDILLFFFGLESDRFLIWIFITGTADFIFDIWYASSSDFAFAWFKPAAWVCVFIHPFMFLIVAMPELAPLYRRLNRRIILSVPAYYRQLNSCWEKCYECLEPCEKCMLAICNLFSIIVTYVVLPIIMIPFLLLALAFMHLFFCVIVFFLCSFKGAIILPLVRALYGTEVDNFERDIWFPLVNKMTSTEAVFESTPHLSPPYTLISLIFSLCYRNLGSVA
ncbi:MAG TPA: hypothetical protein V6C97_27550 [Oculatellaceae cyanobacterium]